MYLYTVTAVWVQWYTEKWSVLYVYISFDTLGFDIRQQSRWDVKSPWEQKDTPTPPKNELQAVPAVMLAAEIDEIKAVAAEEQEAAWVATRKQRSLFAVDKYPSMAEFLHQRTVLHQYRNFLCVCLKLVSSNDMDRSLAAMEIENRFRQEQFETDEECTKQTTK